jgi:hypothetical protein
MPHVQTDLDFIAAISLSVGFLTIISIFLFDYQDAKLHISTDISKKMQVRLKIIRIFAALKLFATLWKCFSFFEKAISTRGVHRYSGVYFRAALVMGTATPRFRGKFKQRYRHTVFCVPIVQI